jgi:REP element-mobilizing transposase RayT
MRIPRSILVSARMGQYFHVVSRVVGRQRLFGDVEKGQFLQILRRYEAFSGMKVMSYCLMGNHFHLLLFKPPRPAEIPDEEVWRRMGHIYSEDQISAFESWIEEQTASGDLECRRRFLERMRLRMFDLSAFMKDIKMRFSKWYNRENDRKGTLWEERFKSLVIEGEEGALLKTAAYIELNPVRAGIVDDPATYRWCSYAEAVAGGKKALKGIRELISGRGNLLEPAEVLGAYRLYFVQKSVDQSSRRPGFTQDQLEEEKKRHGRLSVPDALLARVRYFTDGAILGSREFVRDFLWSRRSEFPRGRKQAFRMRGADWEGLYSYRNLRV